MRGESLALVGEISVDVELCRLMRRWRRLCAGIGVKGQEGVWKEWMMQS